MQYLRIYGWARLTKYDDATHDRLVPMKQLKSTLGFVRAIYVPMNFVGYGEDEERRAKIAEWVEKELRQVKRNGRMLDDKHMRLFFRRGRLS